MSYIAIFAFKVAEWFQKALSLMQKGQTN